MRGRCRERTYLLRRRFVNSAWALWRKRCLDFLALGVTREHLRVRRMGLIRNHGFRGILGVSLVSTPAVVPALPTAIGPAIGPTIVANSLPKSSS